jgi:hypothetical protein
MMTCMCVTNTTFCRSGLCDVFALACLQLCGVLVRVHHAGVSGCMVLLQHTASSWQLSCGMSAD